MSSSHYSGSSYSGGYSGSSSSGYYPSEDLKEYFVPGFGISRHIMMSHVHFYLGPEASVRPYTYRGREGYLIIAPGRPLTKTQIEDLQNLSRQYEQQAAERMGPQDYAQDEFYINQPIQIRRRR